jgi:hypothetical protein
MGHQRLGKLPRTSTEARAEGPCLRGSAVAAHQVAAGRCVEGFRGGSRRDRHGSATADFSDGTDGCLRQARWSACSGANIGMRRTLARSPVRRPSPRSAMLCEPGCRCGPRRRMMCRLRWLALRSPEKFGALAHHFHAKYRGTRHPLLRRSEPCTSSSAPIALCRRSMISRHTIPRYAAIAWKPR